MAVCVVADAEPPSVAVDFNREVRPLLSRNCFRCHGEDAEHREANLRLDERDAATAALPSGTTPIVSGQPDKSEIVARIIASDDSVRMPPPDSGNKLKSEEIALLRRWIEQGAAYAEHWAFVPPNRPPLPEVKREWARNPIDCFILSRLEREGLAPSPEASRYELTRRLSLDLRGLPTEIETVDDFVRDENGDAFERLADQFLADPAYGERWARPWLDLARYADSRGLGSDPLRPNAWRYRDWLIDALNANMRYDEFTAEQLAGDLLPNATLEQRMATAFHRNTMTNTEGGTDDEEFRVAAVKDRIETTARVWMGLSLQCANCHDHKYDPLTQREYYQFFAVFNQTADADRGDEAPVIEAPTDLSREQLAAFEAQVNELKQKIGPAPAPPTAPTPKPGETAPQHEPTAEEREQQRLRDELAKLEKSRPETPTLPVMQELPADKRRTSRIMLRGNFLTPGDEVSPGFLERVAPAAKELPRDRLGAARWLMDRNNPLVARVAVNRLWSQLFGIGLVETEEDFGTQGDPPSHPELLDWLAVEFLESGWDVKHMLKLMVTSATYRQSSRTTPELQEKDPRNRWLGRGPRFRLEAEVVRDQALALSGLLSRKMHGASVYPYQPPGLWRAAFNGERTWATSEGEEKYRRALYTFWRRTVPYPSMQTFDAPSREMCTIRRIRTNTPLQAFVTLNDPVFVEAAQSLARRILKEGGTDQTERLKFAIRLCQGRPAEQSQIDVLARLLASERASYQASEPTARKMAAADDAVPADAAAEMAAWTVVANVLLNLDGVLTKG
jgi:hypothetical protein